MTRYTAASAALVLLAVVLVFPPTARADGFTVTLAQVGSDVVATGSGAINLTGLSFSSGTVNAGMTPNLSEIGVATGSAAIGSGVFSGPSSFGPGSSTIPADSSSGSAVYLGFASSTLAVPIGYSSQASLSGTSTYNNATFSSLGVTPGTYTWTWGNGIDQKFTLQIEAPPAVPEPSSLLLMGSGTLALIGFMRRKLRI